ncbi:MAG: class I SAM-dependent methyltransferase [Nannocystaceae bacterium]|nr:class I SAM-dependent methyltransferase [Nannocystaceae bacterium]
MTAATPNTEGLQSLGAIPKTLLITVWGRAMASEKPLTLINDPFAVKMKESEPHLFEPLETLSKYSKRFMAIGLGVRTQCFDEAVGEFLAKHPDGLVLNIGCGLDARAHRLDNGEATWVDVDLPDSIAWRRRVLPTKDNHHLIEGSLTEPASWLGDVPRKEGQAVFVTSEGTFPYFDEAEIRSFLTALIDHFGPFGGYIELTGDLSKDRVHPSVRAIGSEAPFRSGFRKPAEALARMHDDVRVLGHESLFRRERPRWGLFRWLTALMPSLHDRVGSVLISFAVEATANEG